MVFNDEQIQAVRDRIAAEQAEKRAEIERTLGPLREKTAELQAAKLKAKADLEKARDEARQREAAQWEKEQKEATRRTWIANGGAPADFEEAWPKLRQELLTKATLDQQAKARTAARSWTHHNF